MITKNMTKTKKLVIAAFFAAITLVATMIKLPLPMANGYVNLGDCMVLLCGWLLGPAYGFGAAGLGSALTDIIYGYAVYMPATFIIKGLMALLTYYISRLITKKIISRILSAFVAEVIMVLGYYMYEALIFGFSAAAVSIPGNTLQGIFGIIMGLLLINVLKKIKQ